MRMRLEKDALLTAAIGTPSEASLDSTAAMPGAGESVTTGQRRDVPTRSDGRSDAGLEIEAVLDEQRVADIEQHGCRRS